MTIMGSSTIFAVYCCASVADVSRQSKRVPAKAKMHPLVADSEVGISISADQMDARVNDVPSEWSWVAG